MQGGKLTYWGTSWETTTPDFVDRPSHAVLPHSLHLDVNYGCLQSICSGRLDFQGLGFGFCVSGISLGARLRPHSYQRSNQQNAEVHKGPTENLLSAFIAELMSMRSYITVSLNCSVTTRTAELSFYFWLYITSILVRDHATAPQLCHSRYYYFPKNSAIFTSAAIKSYRLKIKIFEMR